MIEGQGLAGQRQQDADGVIKEVVQMLLQGASPEELVQMGVPAAVIDQAIAIIEQQQAPTPVQGQGLAGSNLF